LRLAITGATGRVGLLLIPLLADRGIDVVLIGRDTDRLRALFPGRRAFNYQQLADAFADCNAVIHLATLNTDSAADADAFQQINVSFALEIAQRAVEAAVPVFIYTSSTHALNPADQSPYAESKRRGAAALAGFKGLRARTVYLAAVHGGRFSGTLTIFNRLPGPLARFLFPFAAALKPTLHVQRLADGLVDIASGTEAREMEFADDVILSDGQAGNSAYQGIRRFLDITFSVAVVVFFWWLLALAYGAVRLESKGPGIFRQARVGRDGVSFTCYKFRTMHQDTPHVGTHEVAAASVTATGGFLRRTKLDELPQIVNLLRGEMTLIGPRPCLPSQTQLVEERRKRGVLALMPGISGLAQVQGIDMSDPVRLARTDALYLATQGLILDLKIALSTFTGRSMQDRVNGAGEPGA
jgi:lipopolysaccharide/colanic/teichoic acid biosynthesis glycosyltransferase